MKRIVILLVVLLVLILGYALLRAYANRSPFTAPDTFKTSLWNTEHIDEWRFVFGGGKQMVLNMRDGGWQVDGFAADQSKVDQLFGQFASVEVTSRASTNPENHARFEVDGEKGLRLSMVNDNTVIQELILGKTAGGDTVYARLPETNEVYILAGLQRYFFTEEQKAWRERSIADFTAERMRRVQYAEGPNQWDLIRTAEQQTLTAPRIAAVQIDTEKSASFLARIANIQSVDFPTRETQTAAADGLSTMATVTIDLGAPDTFERRVVWTLYDNGVDEYYLLVRDSDGEGFYVDRATYDDVFRDYPQTKTNVTLTPDEIAARDAAMAPSEDK